MAWDWDKLQEQRKRSFGGGGGGTPPNMDELIEKIKGARKMIPGGSWIIIVLAILVFLGSSCFYTVAVDEVGVVQRFGKYIRTTQPGLNFKMPTGIETVTKVKIRFVYKEEFGFRTVETGTRTRLSPTASYQHEYLMLTADLNVAVVPWIVHYRINEPYNYLFKVKDVVKTFRDLAEASMRIVVGDSSINEVISKREEIAHKAQALLEQFLSEAEAGIKVTTVEMRRTNVPEPVQPSFNEVNQSVQEKERMIYQARESYNRIIPAARGQAERTIRGAEGYALDRVNRAQGNAVKFLEIYKAYATSKDVTRTRLYLEAMQEILPKTGRKYIVDSEQKNLLPLLNLGAGMGTSAAPPAGGAKP